MAVYVWIFKGEENKCLEKYTSLYKTLPLISKQDLQDIWPCAHCNIGGNRNLWHEIHFNISFRLQTLKLTDVFNMPVVSFCNPPVPASIFSSKYEPVELAIPKC